MRGVLPTGEILRVRLQPERRRGSGTLTTAVILAICSGALPTNAAVYRVDSEATIATAIAAARAGDEIVVADGTYTFPVRINGHHGTAAAPIVLRAETIGGVKFTGNNLSDHTKLRVERNHWVIDGFRFESIRVPGASSTDRVTVIRLRDASDNILRNLSIDNCGLNSSSPDNNAANNSIYLDITDSSARNLVERSEFLNSATTIVVRVAGGATDVNSTDNVFRYNYWSGHSNFETLQLSWGSTNDVPFRTLVEHNLWRDNDSTSELISSKSSQNVFRYNTFDHNDDQLVLRSGDGSTIDSNYFLGGRGIRAYGADHTITNNYFEGSFGPERGNLKGGILIGAGDSDNQPYAPFRDSEVANNTLVNTGGVSLLYGMFYGSTLSGDLLDVEPEHNRFDDNLIVNNEGQAIRREQAAPDTSNQWSGNYVWSTDSGSPGYAPIGVVTDIDPQIERDALGNYVATIDDTVGARIRYRRLTPADVGPGSTFVAGLAGDYDQNGIVDPNDLRVWWQLFASRQLAADGNGDGVVNLADYAVWRDNLSIPASFADAAIAITIPEPGGAYPTTMMATMVALRRGRALRGFLLLHNLRVCHFLPSRLAHSAR